MALLRGEVRTPLYQGQARCVQEHSKEGTVGAAEPPTWSYPHGGGATIVAGPVYTASRYPAGYQGDIFVGDYVQGWVKRLDIDSSDRVTGVQDFATGWPTGVDLVTMPHNGDVAYVDLGWGDAASAVRRFAYPGGANGPPTAKATGSPTSGPPPLNVTFNGGGSSRPRR